MLPTTVFEEFKFEVSIKMPKKQTEKVKIKKDPLKTFEKIKYADVIPISTTKNMKLLI